MSSGYIVAVLVSLGLLALINPAATSDCLKGAVCEGTDRNCTATENGLTLCCQSIKSSSSSCASSKSSSNGQTSISIATNGHTCKCTYRPEKHGNGGNGVYASMITMVVCLMAFYT